MEADGFPRKKEKSLKDAPAKKKSLRRKISFKAQYGIDGMEVADTERMYLPSRKKKIPGKKRTPKKTKITTPKAAKRIIRMGSKITITELSQSV